MKVKIIGYLKMDQMNYAKNDFGQPRHIIGKEDQALQVKLYE